MTVQVEALIHNGGYCHQRSTVQYSTVQYSGLAQSADARPASVSSCTLYLPTAALVSREHSTAQYSTDTVQLGLRPAPSLAATQLELVYSTAAVSHSPLTIFTQENITKEAGGWL